MNNLGDTDTFGQIKNDFNLLYTDEYITMIPDDLLKLELELLIEKMFEIVNQLLSIDDPPFKGTNIDEYKAYKRKILPTINYIVLLKKQRLMV